MIIFIPLPLAYRLSLACLALCGLGFVLLSWEYHSLADSPQAMTLEEAVPSPQNVPDGSRWVRLAGDLSLDCEHVVRESSTYFVATGPAGRIFMLTFHGDPTCREASEQWRVGILKKAGSRRRILDRNEVPVPSSPFPLMELEVGEAARRDLREGIWSAGLLVVMFSTTSLYLRHLLKRKSEDAKPKRAKL